MTASRAALERRSEGGRHQDIIAEFTHYQLARGRGIFQYVMQDTGDDAFYIHVHLGKNPCHGNRVVNIGFARYPYLAFVRLGTEQVGTVDLFDTVLIHVLTDQVTQVRYQEALFAFITRHGGDCAGIIMLRPETLLYTYRKV